MITIYCDGLCEPTNPGGWACYGWIAYAPTGVVLTRDGQCLGHGKWATNNVAEYGAVLRALEWALAEGHESVLIRTDSQLIVKQLTGEWACNVPKLRSLRQRVHEVAEKLGEVTFEWVPRTQNEEADGLSRAAYQKSTGRPAPSRVGRG